MEMKTCRTCGKDMPIESFRLDARRGTRRSDCRSCASVQHKKWAAKHKEHLRSYDRKRYRDDPNKWERHIRAKYGIAPADFEEMLVSQGGVCAICESSSPGKGHKRFNIDHDHKTGEVRGLLCWPCNTGIGKLKDSPERLRKAADYIESSRRKPKRSSGQ